MAIYTKVSNPELMKVVDQQYGMTNVNNIQPITGGNANTSYLLETSDCQYILTILEEKNDKQANELALMLRWLKTHGFKTSSICRNISGEYVSKINQKPMLLKEWLTGGVIEELDVSKLKEVGKSLARLHKIQAPEFLPKSHAYGMHTFSEVIIKGVNLEYESWLKSQLLRISEKVKNEFPKGMIHGDLFYDNILFEDERFDICYVIDAVTNCLTVSSTLVSLYNW